MKILLTGFTQRMTNSQKLRYDYLTSIYVLRDALQRMGHEVDHRAVTPGEDLSGYDRALIGISPTKSFTARFVPGSAYAFKDFMQRGVKPILMADDWSIEKTGYDFKNTLGRFDKWLKFFNDAGPVKGQELTDLSRQADVQDMLDIIAVSGKDLKLLAPMFTWGDHQLLMKGNLPSQLVAWDPTPLCQARVYLPRMKERAWIMATLQKKLNLPKGTWPLKPVGNKREGQAYLPENEILKLYAEFWGVVCPPYQKAGSGWWRARYQHAADAGSVLWLNPQDKAVMGPCYHHNRTDYERMNDSELAAVARQQREWFYANAATLDRTLQVLTEVLA